MASFIVYGDASGQVTVAAPAVAGSNTITFPAETGTLVTSASTISALPGQIAWDTTVKTSGFTAVAYGGYFCNTTSSAFTVTLPATPTRGQFVVIVDYAGTSASNNITVSGNGANINGAGNAILATNRQGITFTYIDSTQGWLATSNVYGGSTPFTQPYTASYLVVAGGGGAGNSIDGQGQGGGGGAGGYLTGTLTLQPGTVYTATVGGGGGSATSGSNSSFPGVTASVGGGRGGGFPQGAAGTNGGSGGGGASGSPANIGGTATSGQGSNGGAGNPSTGAPYGGGGGGGAGATGSSQPPVGNGGNGLQSSITGTSTYYAGGGGASGANRGSGGLGGGANASPNQTPPAAATANTGGGGGGVVGPANGGSGGSGVVILSVPTSRYTGTTTGSPTITTSGSNTIIKFTSSGTYTA